MAPYPDHWNVGDSAIWCGTMRVLSELGVRVGYGCDPWTYDPHALRAAVPDGPILLLGGGNFGDAYAPECTTRARILSDFADRRIIQLPQSIWFRNPDSIPPLASLLSGARDFTLLLRDRASLAIAQRHFPGVAAALCPDAAMALDVQRLPCAAHVPVLALWRHDAESLGDLPELPEGWCVRDWVTPEEGRQEDEARLVSITAHEFRTWVGATPSWPPPPVRYPDDPHPLRRRMAWRYIPEKWDSLAHERTRRGVEILSRGRVVITNRLHAHLLCLLAGIPHVVCDTANGKVFAHRDTWLGDVLGPYWSGCPVRFTSSAAAAISAAKELIAP